MNDLFWPAFDEPGDLATVEAVPLGRRGLPGTTYDVLRRAAELWPDRVALSVLTDAAHWDHPVERTFVQLLEDVHRSANLFHALGVRRADAVALLAPNCDELITATLAAELAGIAAPINSALSPDHIAELLRRSGARVLVAAGPDLAPEVWGAARKLAAETDLEALIALGPTGSQPGDLAPLEGVEVGQLKVLAAQQPAGLFLGEPPGGCDLAALFHTGGTTGTPKLAAHTHTNEVSDAWMIAATPLMRDGSTVFAALPLFHVNAVHVTLLAPLLRGTQAVWAGPLGYRDHALFPNYWRIVERYRVTAMSAVPTVYSVLAGCPVDADVSSLRWAVVGASPLPPAVRDSFESATGIQLVEGYGLTEATCASAFSLPGHRRRGAVGLRLPYQEVKAVGVAEDGRWTDLQPGEPGLLAISGPTVFAGYLTGRDANGPQLDGLDKLRDGWLDTGDLAQVDEEGFVYLIGRAKDLIIRGGHNIDPAVIEDALLAHPAVTGAEAVGRPDLHAGEVPVAFVTVAPGSTTSAEELRAWAASHVSEQAAVPKAVTVLDAIPVTSVGKPFKPALRAQATRDAVADSLADVPGVAAVDAVVEGSSVVVVVHVDDDVDETAVKQSLDRYAIDWRWEKS